MTKQQLIDQATVLFRMKGYSATSINEIVQACGITKGSLYHHFASKEALGLATLEQLEAYFDEHIFCKIRQDQPIAGLAAFNLAIEEFFWLHPNGCLLANLSLEIGTSYEPFQTAILHFFSKWQSCYYQAFIPFYPAAQAKTLSIDALAIVQGCILMYRVNGNIEPLQRQQQALLRLAAKPKS
jgi:AcrR family transcriptional regulator